MTSFEDRFWAKVAKGNGCWRWTASLTAAGYGQIHCGTGPVYAHRVSYEFAKGPIPSGLQIDHLCRNRWCVNPAHLDVVTNRENALRALPFRPLSASGARVTWEQALEIRRRRTAGERGRDLALEFGIAEQTVCNIFKGRAFADETEQAA